MKHRVFVAVGIPPSLQEEILQWEKKLESLPVRWHPGKNLHMTLAPPWYVVDWTSVATKLKALSHEPFYLQFTRVSFGPKPRESRLIWAEGGDSKDLAILREKIHAALMIQPERQPFHPHLTLARFKAEDFKNFPTKVLDERVYWQFEVHSILLMESRLSPEGADYEVLEEIPFVVE